MVLLLVVDICKLIECEVIEIVLLCMCGCVVVLVCEFGVLCVMLYCWMEVYGIE